MNSQKCKINIDNIDSEVLKKSICKILNNGNDVLIRLQPKSNGERGLTIFEQKVTKSDCLSII